MSRLGQIINSHLSIQIFEGRYIPDLYDLYGLYDLYDLAHVAEWAPYNLLDLRRARFLGWMFTSNI